MQLIGPSKAACTKPIPIHAIALPRYRKIPHGGFAAVQDDILLRKDVNRAKLSLELASTNLSQ
jgi:hypothetical protein